MHRLTISITPKQASLLDEFIAIKRYRNRSEGFRDIIKRALESHPTASVKTQQCAAHLSFAFNSHHVQLASQLAALYQQHRHIIVSCARLVMGDTDYVETVILRGESACVVAAANLILGVVGVRHGQINLIPINCSQQ
jgi:CopG family transcriptional regulator, nickel-responsive regulator